MLTSVKLAAVAGGALLLIHFLAIDASSLKNKLKLKSSAISAQDPHHDLPVLEEPEEIDFPRSTDQSSRVPRAISYGWTKADCDAAAAKHPCQKCKCTDDECMLLTESCAEDTVCPLVEDKPVKSGPCCHTCPTYGDGGLEALEAECNRRAVEKAALEGELCPSVCVCVQNGPFPICSKEPVRMCANECHTKYGSDPCARCECEEGSLHPHHAGAIGALLRRRRLPRRQGRRLRPHLSGEVKARLQLQPRPRPRSRSRLPPRLQPR